MFSDDSHMDTNYQNKLIKYYENPHKYFIHYPIGEDPLSKENLSKEEKEKLLQIPDEYRIQIKPEMAGLANCLAVASELAYEIANGIPNNTHKLLAFSYVKEICKEVSKACEPQEKDND